MMDEIIKKNLAEIKKVIDGKAVLVAVTKSAGTDEILVLKGLGCNSFAENRVKDAERKINAIPDAEWHLIGHLQSNKVKDAVMLFSVIQSVDSVRLAEKIDCECGKQGKVMRVLLQVNIAKEPQKSGFFEEEIEDALSRVSDLKNIKLEGFMMIAPDIGGGPARQYFRRMREIFLRYEEGYGLETLSMGMSSDYHVAIEEGSSMVRIGSGLFKRG